MELFVPTNKQAEESARGEIIMAKAKPKTKSQVKKTAKTKTSAKAKPNGNTKKSAILRKTATSKGKASARSDEDVLVHWMIEKITEMTDDFVAEHDSDTALTGQERMRLIGAGVRNYGFIEKAWDIVRENPDFVPNNFSAAQFQQNIQMLDDYRQLTWVLEKFLQAVNEAMLLRADASFRDALRVYNSLKEQARGRVHGAEPLFRALLRFFRRRRPAEELEETEPTIKELERDFNKIVHGKAEGEIIVKNKKAQATGGKREIIDDVHTGRAVIKETKEGEIKE